MKTKKLCKRGIMYCFVFILVFALSCTTVNAASTVASTNKSKLIEIPNKNDCTNFGAFCINGSTAYALKTNSTDTQSTLYTITNFNDASKAKIVSTKLINNLGHGNGMDYYNGKLWVTTCTKILVKMSTAGVVEKRYTTPDGVKLNAISYCRDNKFLVTVGNNVNDEYTVFKTAVLDEAKNKLVYKKTFKIKAPTLKGKYDKVIPQGFCYNSSDRCLYMVYAMRKIGEDHSRYNFVFKVNLSDDIINGHTYTPSKKFSIHADSSNLSAFEAESWAMVGTAKYCGFNAIANGKAADAIYRITNAN